MRLGLGYLHKQEAVRFLASYQFIPETPMSPSLNGSVGVQGIGTGNPGYSLTAEKNFTSPIGTVNVFTGLGWRSNENHGHLVSGTKLSLPGGLSFGLQLDGHQHNPFVTYEWGTALFGLYLIDGETPAYLVGLRF